MAENKISVIIDADGSKAIGELSKVQDAMAKLQDQVGKSSADMQSSLTKSINSISSKLSSFGANMTGLFTAPLALLGKSLFTSASEIEQAAISFEVFTGSAETAKRLMSEFKDIAISSPLQFQDIAKGSQVLMGYGVTANQVTPIVKMLGDISGGNADKFNRLALAFGQVNAAGRLMGQENRQMINAGFNPLLSISEKTGESIASLTKRMQDGKISVQEVADAFYYATSEGGRFNGMAERQAQTLGGLFNKLNESIYLALSDIGKSLADNAGVKDFFKSIADSITTLKNSFLELSPEWQSFILKMGLALGLLGPLSIGLAALIKVFGVLRIAVLALTNTLGGYMLIGGAVVVGLALLAGKIYETATAAKASSLAFRDWKDSIKDAMDESKDFKFDTISNQITVLEGKIKDLSAAIETRKQFLFGKGITLVDDAQIQKLNQYKKELQNLKDIQQKNLGFSTTGKGGDDSITKAERNRFEKLSQQAREGYSELENQFKTSHERRIDIFDRYAQQELKKYQKLGIDTTNIEKTHYNIRVKLAKEELAKMLHLVNKPFSLSKIVNTLSDMADAQIDKFSKISGVIKTAFDASNNSIRLTRDELLRFSPAMQITLSNLQDFDEEFRNRFLTLAATIKASVKDFIVNGLSSIASAFEALGSGEGGASAIRKFAVGITNALGDMFIQIGTGIVMASKAVAAIQAFLASMFTNPAAGVIGGLALIAVGGFLKGVASKLSKQTSAVTGGVTQSTQSPRSSGSMYQYGGSAFNAQTVRLQIDLTGAITASPTGYNINKSFETVLRVTGRE